MAWLGPSLIFAGCPLAFGYAWYALRRASDRWPAYIAMGVSGLELIGWCLFVVMVVVSNIVR